MMTTFDQIMPGTPFYYGGILYVKTESIIVSGEGYSSCYNCIVTDTGSHEWFGDDEEIEVASFRIPTRKYNFFKTTVDNRAFI